MSTVKTAIFTYGGKDSYLSVVGSLYDFDIRIVHTDGTGGDSILLPLHDSFMSKGNATLVILKEEYTDRVIIDALIDGQILRQPKRKDELLVCSNKQALDYYIDKETITYDVKIENLVALMLPHEVFNRKYNRVMTTFFNISRVGKSYNYPELYLTKVTKDILDSKGSIVWSIGGNLHGREQSQFWVKVYYNDKEYTDTGVKEWLVEIARHVGITPVTKGVGVK